MTIAITETQKRELNDWGWTVLENVLVDVKIVDLVHIFSEYLNPFLFRRLAQTSTTL